MGIFLRSRRYTVNSTVLVDTNSNVLRNNSELYRDLSRYKSLSEFITSARKLCYKSLSILVHRQSAK